MVWHALHSAIKTTHIRRRKVVLVFEDDGHAVFSMNYVEAAQVFKLNQQRKVFQLREEELFSSAITKRISTIVQ